MAEDSIGAMQGAAGGFKAGAQTGNPIAAGAGLVLGGIVGLGAGQNTKRARVNLENTIAEYMNQLQNLDMPRYEDLKLSLERYARGEPLTMEQITALQELDSEVSKIAYDKTAKQTQLDALAALKARSRGGLTLQDKADLLNAQREIDRQQSGVQKSIVQNMQARGVAGSGVELAQRMAAQQQGAQLASQNALNVAGNAQNRAMQALTESSRLAGDIGDRQLGMDKMRANALDEMRRRNLERKQAAMQFNVSGKNLANQANWQRTNTVADKNVDIGNTEQARNKDLLWQDYENQKNRLAEIYTGQFGKIGEKQRNLQRRQQEQQGYMDMINSLGSMGNPFSGMMGGGSKGTGGGGPTAISGIGSGDSFQSAFGGGNWSFK